MTEFIFGLTLGIVITVAAVVCYLLWVFLLSKGSPIG